MTNDQWGGHKVLESLNRIIIIHMQFSSATSNETKSKVYEGINIRKYAADSETNKKSTWRKSKYVKQMPYSVTLFTKIDSPVSFNF